MDCSAAATNVMYAPTSTHRKVTAPELQARKGGEKIAMVTAYDYTMARLVDAAGVDMVLVGDSLGMVVQGLGTTIPVTLEEMAYHCRAVARGLARAHMVGDLPFMSYQVSPSQAVESAGRLMKEGACESVKLEGGVEVAEHIQRIVRAGIPVVGHVGLTPQSVHALGGFKVQGRGEAAARVLEDARAVAQAGAFAVVLEAIPPDLAAEITASLDVPTIGIGAGAACDGQVLVCTDLLGMGLGRAPKFAKAFSNVGEIAVESFARFVAEVREGAFPAVGNTYRPNVGAAPPPDGARPPPETHAPHAELDFDAPLALDLWH